MFTGVKKVKMVAVALQSRFLSVSNQGGNKKKKKAPSPELRSDPPIVRTLGSLHISLEKLLAGASLLETTCDFGVQITERSVSPPLPKDKVPAEKQSSLVKIRLH